MVFRGRRIDTFSPDLEISDTSGSPWDRLFFCRNATIEFHKVKFLSQAPDWDIQTSGIIEVHGPTVNNPPNDITVGDSGLLDIKSTFTCNGTLSNKRQIEVSAGKIAKFEAAP